MMHLWQATKATLKRYFVSKEMCIGLEWLKTQSYCELCDACNRAKPPAPQPVPMINTPIGRPWEMLGVDILKVLISCQGNSYLLVIQDYFTKWPIAIPLQDQTAASVVRALTDTFSIYGIPSFLHSDQGANFESTILKQTCEAFGIHKSRTTAYHPQGDGLVERVNCSLLQMFRTYCNQSSDWEQWLPLLLYAYRSSTHTSTKCSPYLLMFGREPSLPVNTSELAHDTQSYSQQIQRKLAQMFELVELHLIESGSSEKAYYDSKSASRLPFLRGSHVWLSVPSAGKLDPKWECGWTATQQIAEQPTVQIKHKKEESKQFILISYDFTLFDETLTQLHLYLMTTRPPQQHLTGSPPSLSMSLMIEVMSLLRTILKTILHGQYAHDDLQTDLHLTSPVRLGRDHLGVELCKKMDSLIFTINN